MSFNREVSVELTTEIAFCPRQRRGKRFVWILANLFFKVLSRQVRFFKRCVRKSPHKSPAQAFGFAIFEASGFGFSVLKNEEHEGCHIAQPICLSHSCNVLGKLP